MNKKTVLVITIVMVLMLIATACSGGTKNNSAESGGDQPSETKATSEDQITLRVQWWGPQIRHDDTLKVIRMYEEQNPHVKIEAEFSSFDGYWQSMAAQAAGNNLPDVMTQNFGEYITQYTERGLMVDLNEFVEDGTIDGSNISADVLDSGTLDGKLVGISLGTNAFGVFYNPELLELAGVEEPKLGWTWEDYAAAAEKVAAVADYGAFNLDILQTYESIRMFEVYLREHGLELYNEDVSGLGWEDDQVLIDYLQLWLDMLKNGSIPPLEVAQEYNSLENTMIGLGSLGLDIRWANQLVAINNTAKGKLKIGPLPGPNEQQGMYLRPSMLFSIPTTSEHKKEAAKFIDYFTNDLEANKILKGERGVPVSSVIRDAIKPDLDESTQAVFEFIDMVTNNSSPVDKNQPPFSNEIFALIGDAFEKVLYEQITPQEAASEIRQKANEVFSR